MSMQICVLTDSRLSSITEWQKAIDAEGFPLRLSDDDPNRNVVARLRQEEAEIEYDVYEFKELKEAHKGVSFDRDWKYAVAFTWSSNLADEIVAWMAATAYARAAGGVIFDEQEGRFVTPNESLNVVQEIERRRPEMEEVLRRITRKG